jgi:predicted phosphodiesterase
LRVALISDAHGNAVGLRAALDDIAGRGVDAIVSLGDVAQGGPQPVECLELVRAADARTVMGNSDAFLLDPHASTEEPTERHLVQREWTLSQLTQPHLDYIRSFEPTVELDLDGLRLLCFHGTPRDYDEVVLPEDPPDAFRGADILAGGHVHVPQLRRVGAAWYVNPGSVGLGYDHLQTEDDFRFDPWASYAIVAGRRVEFHRVPFDADDVEAVTRASGMPRAEEGLWRWQPRQCSG